MPIQAVIFDLGGTLLHYHDPLSDDPARPFRRITLEGVAAFTGSLAAAGYSIPPSAEMQAVVDRLIAESYRAMVRDLRSDSIENPLRAGLAHVGLEPAPEDWEQARLAFYRVVDRIVFPRAGLIDTLSALDSAGHSLSLISNTYWAADVHDRHLDEQGILRLFPLRIYSCNVPYVKPHPSIFNLALDELHLAPEQTVYVGDRPDVDVAGAQSAGMRAVLIRSPYREKDIPDGEPDAIIEELPELIPALEKLNSV
jgi:HAD superfamily hydrolase (TIGR01509 family)